MIIEETHKIEISEAFYIFLAYHVCARGNLFGSPHSSMVKG